MIRILIATAGILALGGCTEAYLRRSDTLRLESGEAVQANIAMQTIDPAPAAAQRYSRDTDGERLQHGIERYRNPQVGAGFGLAPAVPIGATAAPPLGNPLNR
jgi:type IV pilus biogenesis protein CpaD/CtpE